VFERFTDLTEAEPDAEVIAVDIPIGLPRTGIRAADVEARRVLGPRRVSVFSTPPREVLEAPTYQRALEVSRRRTNRGVSKQSYALAPRILEVDVVSRGDRRLTEVHPEVSFATMAGEPLAQTKKSGPGAAQRERLLDLNGIALRSLHEHPRGAERHDVLDAAAAAWTARRAAAGVAQSLPACPPVDERGRPMAIWF
jgi:predicted RNase H-like nuclease